MNVRIKNSLNIGDDWRGRIGEIVAIVKDRRYKEYIIQFTNPTEWSYFKKKEFQCGKKIKK